MADGIYLGNTSTTLYSNTDVNIRKSIASREGQRKRELVSESIMATKFTGVTKAEFVGQLTCLVLLKVLVR